MKKILSILVVAVFITAILIPSKVKACSCNASWIIEDKYLSSWTSDGNDTHHNSWVYVLRCSNCNAKSYTFELHSRAGHNWGSWQDGGHISGTLTHRHSRSCNTCGQPQSGSYSCPGNPCQYPY